MTQGGLCAQDNLLTTLPPEIERLTNLTLLSLKGNPLKILPVELARLPKARRPRALLALHFCPPPSRTNRTRLVPPSVLTGHVSSLPVLYSFLFRAIERTYFSVPGPRRR